MTIWTRLLWVAFAGALGASCRYLVGVAALRQMPSMPFFGTFLVNSVGCLVFGYVSGLARDATWLTPDLRLAILTGFLGAFTTFSTFSYDTVLLFNTRGLPWAAAYVFVQNGAGIALALGGAALARAP